MTIYDISRPLTSQTAVWPGDTHFQRETMLAIQAGSPVNLTTLHLSAHTATHVDAPYHFSQNGATMADVALRPFWGAVQVVTIHKRHGGLTPDDFADIELGQAVRLLVHSPYSEVANDTFESEFVYPTPELAEFLAELDIILYGTDAPSMDAVDSKTMPGHHALLKNGIAILEGVQLTGIPDGLYELSALPLAIVGGDGSPVRAVLRDIEN